MSRLILPGEDLRRAGRARARTAQDLIDFLDDVGSENFRRMLDVIRRPIAGCSQELAQLITNPSTLTTSNVTLAGGGAQAFLEGVGQEPLVMGFGYVPNTTGVGAGASVTYSLVRTDTSAVFSSIVSTNSGASSAAVGSGLVFGIVPFGIPATNGVALQGLGSSAGPQPIASATTPILLALVGVS